MYHDQQLTYSTCTWLHLLVRLKLLRSCLADILHAEHRTILCITITSTVSRSTNFATWEEKITARISNIYFAL